MYSEEFNKVAEISKVKAEFLKDNPVGYFISSILAGIFVGIGVLLSFTSAALVSGMPYQKIIMGATFGIALSLVILAGSELFTGNNLVMSAGNFTKKINISSTIKIWIVCFIGNWVGSILLALLFINSGLAKGDTLELFNTISVAKTTIPFSEILIRAILCNMLVCLAVWSSLKLKSESAKLIMIWWCLIAFIVIGFEHSIANMTVLTIGIFNPDSAIELSGYMYNIFAVTLGNIIGGVGLVSLPYFIISKVKKGSYDGL
ncbi:MAG: formate/nitrite transporter family protein [Bacilli bacterium]